MLSEEFDDGAGPPGPDARIGVYAADDGRLHEIEACVPGMHDAPIRLVHQLDLVIDFAQGLDQIERPVGRAVIHHDDTVYVVSLIEQQIQAFADVVDLVEHRNYHTESVHFDPLIEFDTYRTRRHAYKDTTSATRTLKSAEEVAPAQSAENGSVTRPRVLSNPKDRFRSMVLIRRSKEFDSR
ncbi:hypothetical protein QNA19_23635 [Rhodococcus fascians]|nr:hypothetical protein [Rhodococcus fascians]MDJ0428935.1 hypothetical protein [Rhodococcus fascians]